MKSDTIENCPNMRESDNCLAKLTQSLKRDGNYAEDIKWSVALLTCDDFSGREAAWQVSALTIVFNRLISSLNMQSGLVASLIAPHFRRLLRDPGTDLKTACLLHDIVWGLWWCAASSFDEMRPIYSHVCLPFHDFLKERGLVADATPPIDPEPAPNKAHLRIAYFLHYAHGAQENALAPIIVSLAKAHSDISDRSVFIYAVQWIDQEWLAAAFHGSEVIIRTFDQKNNYDQIDPLIAQIRADDIDVILSEVTSSITAAVFARRAAPLQLRVDLGLPYWFYPEVDFILLSGKPWRDCYPYEKKRTREFHAAQQSDFIFRNPDWTEVKRIRSEYAKDDIIFGVFTRLVKITPSYLSLIRNILRRHPCTHFILGGAGDPRLVQEFLQRPELRGRVTFIHRNVDLAVYANVLDFFVDTFPFIGGVVCRELVAHGLPIFGLKSNEWSLKQEQERDPASIACNEPAFMTMIDRAINDPEFRRQRAACAIASMSKITDVKASAQKIDLGLSSLVIDSKIEKD